MQSIVDFLYQVKDFLNPGHLINYMLDLLGGYVYLGLWFVVFAETGLAVGFFLPGDSMLVVAGLFVVFFGGITHYREVERDFASRAEIPAGRGARSRDLPTAVRAAGQRLPRLKRRG